MNWFSSLHFTNIHATNIPIQHRKIDLLQCVYRIITLINVYKCYKSIETKKTKDPWATIN